jgi:predicted nucleic acid-binding protein
MRANADRGVIQWVDGFRADELFISAINRAEIERGLNLLPSGKRQKAKEVAAGSLFEAFAGRCLAFDEAAAIVFGRITAERSQSGRPISVEDAQIASIAVVHRLKLVTRNTRDFDQIDQLETINPWR